MKKAILVTGIIFSCTMHLIYAQLSKACITVGGSGNDICNMIRQTADSGFVEFGNTFSFGVTTTDFYIAKLDKNGALQWTKRMDGGNSDAGVAIEQTTDGGYILGGFMFGVGAGGDDCYIARLDGGGNFIWGRTVGGSDNDFASAVQQTADGGYVLGGQTRSFGSGDDDFYIVKLDSSGNFQWSKAIGGSTAEEAYSIQQTADHGYVMAGKTDEFGIGTDVYVVKLDSTGALQWTKTIGGSGNDFGNYIRQTTDHGYVIAGYTDSFGAGGNDVYVIKLDSLGNLSWTRTVGGLNGDFATSIQQTADGGYVVGGYSSSFELASLAVYVVKLDANGNFLWGSVTGGVGDELGNSIQQTVDGGYVAGGITTSFGAGFDDFLLVKIDSSGNSCCPVNSGGSSGSGGTESTGGALTDVTSTVTSTTVTETSGEGTLTANCMITAVNDDPSSTNFSIYPNPNQGRFEVMLPRGVTETTLFVSDVIGSIIYQKDISNLQTGNTIHISLPSTVTDGIYFLKLKYGREEIHHELVIDK